MAFPLKIYHNPAQFPKYLIDNGSLEPPEKRVQWKVGQRIKYYYDADDDSSEEATGILEADILEICRNGEKEADDAIIRHSECLADESLARKDQSFNLAPGILQPPRDQNSSHSSSMLNRSLPKPVDENVYSPDPEESDDPLDENVARVSSPKNGRYQSCVTTKSRKRGLDDPDYIDKEIIANRGKRNWKKSRSNGEPMTAIATCGDVTLADLARAIGRIDYIAAERHDNLLEILNSVMNRIIRLESAVKTGMVASLDDEADQRVRVSGRDGHAVVKKVIQEMAPLIWMGVDVTDKIESFLLANSSLDARKIARKLASKMWGDRTIRYNKISVYDRVSVRPAMKKKDPTGFKLFKGVVIAWNLASTLDDARCKAIASGLPAADIQKKLDNKKKEIEAEYQQRAASFLKVADQCGRDAANKKEREPAAWYWDLINDGNFPTPEWSIWGEIEKNEMEDLKMDRERGVTEEMDEQAHLLKRVRQFEKRLSDGENIDKALYDRYGKLLNE